MSIPTLTIPSQTIAELELFDGQWVRVQLMDGTMREGRVLAVDPAWLELVDRATGANVRVPAGELVGLDVSAPRRGREWTLAVLGIVGATAGLAGWATLPWVRPVGSDMLIGFVILFVIATAFFRALPARSRLDQWLTTWRALDPPR